MREYGIGLRELEEYWTDAQLVMMADRIVERYRRQSEGSGGMPEHKEVESDELLGQMGVVTRERAANNGY